MANLSCSGKSRPSYLFPRCHHEAATLTGGKRDPCFPFGPLSRINFYSAIECEPNWYTGIQWQDVERPLSGRNYQLASDQNNRFARIARTISGCVALPRAEFQFIMRSIGSDAEMWGENWDHSLPIRMSDFDKVGRCQEVEFRDNDESAPIRRVWFKSEALFRQSGPFAGNLLIHRPGPVI